jgi:hypothetical protein
MEIGKQIFKVIREDKRLKPRALMWYYDEDAQQWRLLIATDDARKRGPQAAYGRVWTLLKRAGLVDKIFQRIVVTTPDSPLVKLVGKFITLKAEPGGEPGGVSMLDNTLNGVFIPGIYAYHLDLPH